MLNNFSPTSQTSEPGQSSIHRLGRGLPGYLIRFAPHAFVPQRQERPSRLSSLLAFRSISTHSTAPPSVPTASTFLKSRSMPCYSSVEPRAFTKHLRDRLRTL